MVEQPEDESGQTDIKQQQEEEEPVTATKERDTPKKEDIMPDKPEDKLSQLESELKQRENELGTVTKQRDTLKGDIDALKKIVADVKQTLDAYKMTLEGLLKDKDEMASYVTNKEKMINAAINDEGKQAVIKIRDQASDEIKGIEEEIKRLKKSRKDANKVLPDLREKVDEAQKIYDELKTRQAKISDNLKDLKILKESIEKEEDKNKKANMYFLFQEFDDQLDSVKRDIMPKDDFESALYKAWGELDKAKAELRETEEKLKTLESDIGTKERDVESAKKNRRQTISRKTDNIIV